MTVGAWAEWLPVGAGADPGCPGSTVQLVVEDDFAEPVLASYHLTDIGDGSTLQRFRFDSAFGRPASARLFSETGRWFGSSCNGTVSFVPEGGPAVTIPGLVQRAVDSLDPADPDLAVTPQHGRHLVQLPSWLAVEPAYWNQVRVARARAGRVEVTATLTPTATFWDLGNGDTIECANPGVVWQVGMAEARSTCGYTYTHPSINPPDDTFLLTGTVRFHVSHTTNAPGSYGPFTPVERTATQTIEVYEIQAIEG